MRRNDMICLFGTVLMALSAGAQQINGDMNHSGTLDVNDVTILIHHYLVGMSEVVDTTVDPFAVDNSRVVGTWYKTKSDHFTLNEDGTTDYAKDYTYKFLPIRGSILLYNRAGKPVNSLNVVYLTEQEMYILPAGSDVPVVYTSTKPVVLVGGIYLSKESLLFEVGDSERLTAAVLPSEADSLEVAWSSSDELVATVSANGLVTGVGAGSATITAAARDGSGVKATCQVKVEEQFQSVTSIRLSAESLSLVLAEDVLIKATVLPENASNPALTWSSSNPYVATAYGGKVKSSHIGTTTITVEATDGSGVVATCEVTVIDTREAVDLGLNVNWATTNVGAHKPEDAGGYFCWGHSFSQSYFDWAYYKWGYAYNQITKYNNVDYNLTLEPDDDAATANWGSTWRMPSYDDFEQLRTKCTWTWTTQGGQNGYQVTGPNGNSIFLPAAGYGSRETIQHKGSVGNYWTNYLYSDGFAYLIHFTQEDVKKSNGERCIGGSVRPVCSKNSTR